MLVGAVITGYQILSRPQPVATVQTAEDARLNAQSFDQKIEQLQAPRAEGSAPAEAHFTSDEVSAEVAQSMGAVPAAAVTNTNSTPPPSPNTVVSSGNVQIKGYQVKLEGDVARGQFVANMAGKDVYVTLAGHLGSLDGYVTFDPTEFKVGDLNVPVSLVNDQLQKKMDEQKDRLKLPDFIADLRVENGQLVIKEK